MYIGSEMKKVDAGKIGLVFSVSWHLHISEDEEIKYLFNFHIYYMGHADL